MPIRPLLAIFFIAASAISTASNGQSVYKCGATYNQIPCEGATLLSVEDTRSRDQKMQTEFAAKQDAKLAASLEKARLKEEPKTTQRSPKPSKVDTPASASAAKQQKSVPVTAILKAETANKGNKSKNKEPEYFTATVSSEEAKGKQKNQR